MISNIDYWTAKIRELRLKIVKIDDPYVVKSYTDLIDEYTRQIQLAKQAGTENAPHESDPLDPIRQPS